jgi:chemosensory pili system protein ChpA (sensor histidine kinase/response regulator)
MSPSPQTHDSDLVTQDLAPLAWILEELRRSLDMAQKALRRFVRESETRTSIDTLGRSDMEVEDSSVLRTARMQFHQGAGALNIINFTAAAKVLTACESVLQRYIPKPHLFSRETAQHIEQASFAVLDYLSRLTAEKKASSLWLFQSYATLQELAEADRIHPADLWEQPWQWHSLSSPITASARAANSDTQTWMVQLMLPLMKDATPEQKSQQRSTAARMSDLCSELSAGANSGSSETLWGLAAAVFEAQTQGLLQPDVYSKRVASRLLSHLRAVERGRQEVPEELARDLLFFCAQAQSPKDSQTAPRLAAVRQAWKLVSREPVDYNKSPLGQFDPVILSQARKRVAAAKDLWQAVAAAEVDRSQGLIDQFALVGDSLKRIFTSGELLALELQKAVAQTVQHGNKSKPPSPELAMEVATSLLYIDAAIEDGELGSSEQAEQIQLLSRRLAAVIGAKTPEPLAPWMEQLYSRVSDKQTMGSVVAELRSALNDIEKSLDDYFRHSHRRGSLMNVPQRLSNMRGVLSVLGQDHACAALSHMRDSIEPLLAGSDTSINPSTHASVPSPELFHNLATNLGALGFLIDMLNVQPQAAKSLFHFDQPNGLLVPAIALSKVPALVQEPVSLESTVHPLMQPSVQPELIEQAHFMAQTARAENMQALELTDKAHQLIQEHTPAPQEVSIAPFVEEQALALPEDDASAQNASVSLNELVYSPAKALEPNLSFSTDTPEIKLSIPAPVAANPDEQEMLDIFIEEAHDVFEQATGALKRLQNDRDDLSHFTTLRRAFHTLKGSSRMVGLQSFSEAAYTAELILNDRLSQPSPAEDDFLEFCDWSLHYLKRWIHALPNPSQSDFNPQLMQEAAKLLETHLNPTLTVQADQNSESKRPGLSQPLSLADEFPLLDLNPSSTIRTENSSLAFQPTQIPDIIEIAPSHLDSQLPDFVAPELELQWGNSVGRDSLAPSERNLDSAFKSKTDDTLVPTTTADDTGFKQIGRLRIKESLFEIFLSESQDHSQQLLDQMLEWRSRLPEPAGLTAEVLAHSIAGDASTIGFTALSQVAKLLENVLSLSNSSLPFTVQKVDICCEAAEEIRQLLHQFAAGFLKEADPGLLQRLEALRETLLHPHLESDAARVEQTPPPTFALSDVDHLDSGLFAVFTEEAQDLLPRLSSQLRSWAQKPAEVGLGAGCMRTLHTLKGAARLSGAMQMGEMAHALESQVEALMQHGCATTAAIDSLQGYCDALNQSFEATKRGESFELPSAQSSLAIDSSTQVDNSVTPTLQIEEPGLSVGLTPDEIDEFSKTELAPFQSDSHAPLFLGSESISDYPLQAAEANEEFITSAQFSAKTKTETETEKVDVQSHILPTALSSPVKQEVAPRLIDWSRFQSNASSDNTAASLAEVEPRASSAVSTAPSGSNRASVRVAAPLLDSLVNQAGEISITRSRIEAEVTQLRGSVNDLTDNLQRLREQLREVEIQAETQMNSRIEATKAADESFDSLEFDRFTRLQELTRLMAESVNDVATVQRSLHRTLETTEDELVAQARLNKDLQDGLLRTRMVEFDSLADRLHRVVRQTTKEAGKQVQLNIEGGSIEIDRSILDRMTPAFEHLIRNSVIHGIEAPEERHQLNKPMVGQLYIHVTQEANEVSIQFSDDGGGLDYEKIKLKGQKLKLFSSDAQLSEPELAQLIFTPGFSTAEKITELAGRGVGMDVVNAEVNGIGGRIETFSQPGHGTQFTLHLPLTTAITQVLRLRAGRITIAVPSTLIEEVRHLSLADIQQASQDHRLTDKQATLPFHWMGALLQASYESEELNPQITRLYPVVIARSAQQRIAMHVDEVVGQIEVVVKNLGAQLSSMPGLAGITLLASGAISLIYNPVALANLYGHTPALPASSKDSPISQMTAFMPLDAQQNNPQPLILVVDDSITVRRVTQRLLEREGYRVSLAKDGVDALEKLKSEIPVIMLTDIEMPQMDGFDLVRQVRNTLELNTLPVVMITSRIAQKHRDLALQLGVNHYLGKPFVEEELLALVASYAQAPTALPT